VDERVPINPGAIFVGADEVTFDGDVVVIHARHPIIDWSVREFHHHAIYFRYKKYLLRGKSVTGKPFAMRYELAPWPEDLREESMRSFTYDAEFVAARDAGVVSERRHSLVWQLMLPIYPLLGFAWRNFKRRVLWPMGFEPASITAASTMFTFCVVMGFGVMYGWFGMRLIGHLTDLIILATLSLDCAFRYDQLIRHEEVPDGFLEWLFKYRKRKRERGY
jgi:hypothetical protein